MLIDKNGLGFLANPDGKANPYIPNPFGKLDLDGIDWNPALETANRWFDRATAMARENDRSKRVQVMTSFTADLTNLKNKTRDHERLAEMLKAGKDPAKAKGEAVGDILLVQLFPSLNGPNANDLIRQKSDNLRVAFALAMHHCDFGKYPEKLAELTPKYLEEAPKDLFSGSELIYRPTGTGYLLYSVGLNGKDDGGRSRSDDPSCDDLVIRMPFPGPPPPKEERD
jgi:hypothetical protein